MKLPPVPPQSSCLGAQIVPPPNPGGSEQQEEQQAICRDYVADRDEKPCLKGQINVEVKANDNKVKLSFADNGKGLPQDFDDGGNTLGVRIIKALTHQLEGEFEYLSNGQGTVAELSFSLKNGQSGDTA